MLLLLLYTLHLHCTALNCTALHCTALLSLLNSPYSITRRIIGGPGAGFVILATQTRSYAFHTAHCTLLHTLYWSVLHYTHTVLKCTALHTHTVLKCTALHTQLIKVYPTLDCTTHCTALPVLHRRQTEPYCPRPGCRWHSVHEPPACQFVCLSACLPAYLASSMPACLPACLTLQTGPFGPHSLQ